MKKTVIPVILLVANIALAVVSYFLLPETVVTQLSFGGNATTMAKLPAIAIPCLLGVGGAIWALVAKYEVNKKHYIISGVGIFVFLVMLAVNLIK